MNSESTVPGPDYIEKEHFCFCGKIIAEKKMENYFLCTGFLQLA